MPRYIRKGVKHGGVTGGSRPNSYRTNILPGANPRGDGRLACGHKATQPPRYLARKQPRYKWDTDCRRVCEACYQTALADPESIWREADAEFQPTDPDDSEAILRRDNVNLRIQVHVLEQQLASLPDWPRLQQVARLGLAAEALLYAHPDTPELQPLFDALIDPEVQRFLTTLDRYNMLPDDKPGRLIPARYNRMEGA
jgi:hypothetical protein